ncbi:MAG: hypothetical protein PUP91_24265 [Rhizonema sp. PD37]|nr:hypothetical protein [Rhizonema sp. PD37]
MTKEATALILIWTYTSYVSRRFGTGLIQATYDPMRSLTLNPFVQLAQNCYSFAFPESLWFDIIT